MNATQDLHFQTLVTFSLDSICSDLSHRTFRVWALISAIKGDENQYICIKRIHLASMLKVSVDTIGKALRELTLKGFLRALEAPKKGIYHYERKAEYKEEANAMFPKELLNTFDSIRQSISSSKERATAILNAIAQYLPASILDNNNTPHFIKPKHEIPEPPKAPKPPLHSLQDLEAQYEERITAGKFVEAYEITRKMLVMKRQMGISV